VPVAPNEDRNSPTYRSRRAPASHAARATPTGSPRALRTELFTVLWQSLLAAVNVLVFVAAVCWYRLVGKRLPPRPKPWQRW